MRVNRVKTIQMQWHTKAYRRKKHVKRCPVKQNVIIETNFFNIHQPTHIHKIKLEFDKKTNRKKTT